MQLLVVHHDREISEGLSAMVREYTPHMVECAASDEAARAWLAQNSSCDLLLAQLDAPGIDGVQLASSLGENSAPRQIFFCPVTRAGRSGSKSHRRKFFPNRSTARVCSKRSRKRPS